MQRFKTDRRPLHLQAQQHLLSLIENETYLPGQQFPSEADLAAQLGISRPTLREALLHLEQKGIIVRKHGVGTFVAPQYGHRLESGLEHLESILALAARQGITTQMRGLSVEQVPADEELAERLDVAPDTALTCVRRAIVVKHRPAAYLVDYSPVAVLPPKAIGAHFNGSVLDLLVQQNGIRICEALAEITAVNADALLATQLEVESGQALLLLTETLFTDNHTPIGFSHNYFLPNLFRFHVVRC
ncbi:MAG: GntR family transcriptional regulator [Chloroflexota bacterium]|nr:GntR family transcriptional regulator [Chloroflexota bacterium]